MKRIPTKICVLYDGACPRCIKDRDNYLRLAGGRAEGVSWFDITGKDEQLKSWGIDPHKALTELHVIVGSDESLEKSNKSREIASAEVGSGLGLPGEPRVLSELDAYILLMQKVPVLKPLAWLMGLSLVRPVLSAWYHKSVYKRLKREGRL
ncbi:conserved hypothetical protein [Shewanella sediminis HAW-EB3]|uniref:Thiol-disulphide oxidoreductase DCC n=1 Tax=Shewanella sediminis (strain HAW-EB3) TaxID=425104 RepID=A8FS01_SHESH|nr:DCC1-like thiol-disulfide oxidoreductase family protein [Shewanella sediminis]ABV35624.1 conserved hypothetical protein [Shewanella sediminis HAW-EB3]